MAPSGKLERDTIECLLADVDGKWFGNSAGAVIDNKIWFRTDFQFKELGKYHFLFEQAMREESLTEIIDFGIRIEEKQ
jgi:gliding motility-associated lipoprotein GldH